MAVTLGENSGFVTVAPTADPAGTDVVIDGASVVTKHTSPAGSIRITEIGFWRDGSTNTSNFEIALYSESSGVAATRLYVAPTNSSNVSGWIRTTVDWSISANTAYWLAVQMDSHSGVSNINSAASGGAGIDRLTSQTTLNDPYGGGAVLDADGMYAIYALVETSTHNLTGEDIVTPAAVLDQPTIGQTHVISSEDIVTPAVILDAPTLTSDAGSDDLIAEDIVTPAAILEEPSLTSDIIILQSKSIGKSATDNEDFITLSFDNDLVEGSLIVALYISGSSIDQGPTNFSNPIDLYDAGNDDEAAIFCKVAGPSESKIITCTTVSPDEQALIIYEFAGPFNSIPLDKTDIEEVSFRNTISLSTESTIQNDELALVLVSFRSSIGLINSISDNFIIGLRSSTTDFKAIASAYKKLTSSGIVSLTGNVTNTTVMAGIATFKKNISDDLIAEDIVTPAAVLEAPTLSSPQITPPSLSGTRIFFSSNSNSGSQAITVPAGTTCMLLGCAYWFNLLDVGFPAPSLNGSQFTLVRLIDSYETSGNHGWIGVWRLNNPTSGNFVWDFTDIYTPDEGFCFEFIPLKDVDTSGDPIRDVDVAYATSGGGLQTLTTGSFSSETTDLCLVFGYSYGQNTANPAPTGAGQTEICSDFALSCENGVGYKAGVSGSTTMQFYGNYPSCIAVSVKGLPSGDTDDLTGEDIVTPNAVLDQPTIGQTHVISSEDIVTPNAVLDQPIIGQTHYIFSEDIVTPEAVLDQSTISQIHYISSEDIVTPNAVLDQPTIGQTHYISSEDIVTPEAVLDQPTISQTHYISSEDIVTEPVILGTPNLYSGVVYDLESEDIVTPPAVLDQSTIGQTHYISSEDIITPPAVLDQPTIGQTHYIFSEDIVTPNAVLDQPTIGQTHVISSEDIVTPAAVLEQPTIGQTHYISSEDIVTPEVVLDQPTIGQTHVISSEDIVTSDAVIGAPLLTESHALLSEDIVTEPVIFSQPSIAQTHNISSEDIITAPAVLDAPVLAEELPDQLYAEDIYSQPVIFGQPSIAQIHNISSEDIVTSSAILDQPVVGQTHILYSQSISTINPVLGTPTIGQSHILNSENIETDPANLGQPNLTLVHALTSNDIFTGFAVLEAPNLYNLYNLTANNINASNAYLDSPVISQTHFLLSNDLLTRPAFLGSPFIFSDEIETPINRTYVIRSENREIVIDFERRVYIIPSEFRDITD